MQSLFADSPVLICDRNGEVTARRRDDVGLSPRRYYTQRLMDRLDVDEIFPETAGATSGFLVIRTDVWHNLSAAIFYFLSLVE